MDWLRSCAKRLAEESEEVAKRAKVPKKFVENLARILMELSEGRCSAEAEVVKMHIKKLSEELGLKEVEQEALAEALDNLDAGEPKVLAAAALYRAAKLRGIKVDQWSVARAVGVTAPTLRKVVKRLGGTPKIGDLILSALTKPSTVEEIANATGCNKSSVKYWLRRLEREGKVRSVYMKGVKVYMKTSAPR